MSRKLKEVNDALRAIAEGNNHFAIGGTISCWADYLEECRRDMVSMIVPAVRLCNEIVAEPDRAKKDAEGISDNLHKLYDFIGGKEVDPIVKLVDHSGKPIALTRRTLKMPVISMPGKAAIKYQVDAPELPRLAASIETIKSDDGKVSCDCTLYVGNEVLADMQAYCGKRFALAMVRHALKGAMSRLGKHRRMAANRQSREAAKKEAV